MCARPNVSAERIPQILMAALQVFGRNGLSETRMEDIASAAGLSKATIYLYFKSKDALIAALLQSFLEQSSQGLSIQASDARSSSDVIRNWISAAAAQLGEAKAYAHLGFEFLALAARDANTKSSLSQHYEHYHALLEKLITRGVNSGEYCAVNANQTAKSILAMFEGMHLLWLATPHSVDLEEDSLAAFETIHVAIIEKDDEVG